MDDVALKILVASKDFLGRAIGAEALSGEWLTEAHLTLTALEHQIARERAQGVFMRSTRDGEQALAQLSPRAAKAARHGRVDRHWADLWAAHVGADVSRAIAGILATGMLDSASHRRLTRQLRDFLVGYYRNFDPAIDAGTTAAYKAGRRDEPAEAPPRPIVNGPRLERYLTTRFPERGALRIVELRKLNGGYSKETYLVTLRDARGEERIVLRKDGVDLPTGSSVVDEFDDIVRAGDAGVPVPAAPVGRAGSVAVRDSSHGGGLRGRQAGTCVRAGGCRREAPMGRELRAMPGPAACLATAGSEARSAIEPGAGPGWHRAPDCRARTSAPSRPDRWHRLATEEPRPPRWPAGVSGSR